MKTIHDLPVDERIEVLDALSAAVQTVARLVGVACPPFVLLVAGPTLSVGSNVGQAQVTGMLREASKTFNVGAMALALGHDDEPGRN